MCFKLGNVVGRLFLKRSLGVHLQMVDMVILMLRVFVHNKEKDLLDTEQEMHWRETKGCEGGTVRKLLPTR